MTTIHKGVETVALIFVLMLLKPAGAFGADTDVITGNRAPLGYSIVKELAGMLQNGDYSELYRKLHRSYSEFIEETDFVARFSAAPRRVVDAVARKSSLSESSGYIVVTTWEVRDGTTFEGIEVLFIKRVGGEWQLLNFPFAPGVFPEFFREPCFLCDDL